MEQPKKMLPSPVISSCGESCEKKERLWQINNRLANKHGYCHNVYWVSGDVYRGKWESNKRHGAGIHTYKSGNRYEGDWKDGKREGFGTSFIIDENSDKYRVVYKGSWKAGKKHNELTLKVQSFRDSIHQMAWNQGPGLLYGAFGETYEGSFANGMRNGLGKQTYRCITTGGYHVYHGQWLNDKRGGVGILRMVNGDVYRGSFVEDLKEGKGVYLYRDKCSKYEGLWKQDVAICGTYFNMNQQDQHIPFLEILNSESFAPDLIDEHLASKLVRTNSFSSLGQVDRIKLTPRQ